MAKADHFLDEQLGQHQASSYSAEDLQRREEAVRKELAALRPSAEKSAKPSKS